METNVFSNLLYVCLIVFINLSEKGVRSYGLCFLPPIIYWYSERMSSQKILLLCLYVKKNSGFISVRSSPKRESLFSHFSEYCSG